MIAICYIIKGSKNQVKKALDKKTDYYTSFARHSFYTINSGKHLLEVNDKKLRKLLLTVTFLRNKYLKV